MPAHSCTFPTTLAGKVVRPFFYMLLGARSSSLLRSPTRRDLRRSTAKRTTNAIGLSERAMAVSFEEKGRPPVLRRKFPELLKEFPDVGCGASRCLEGLSCALLILAQEAPEATVRLEALPRWTNLKSIPA
jgi:hypothetical protein